MTTVAPDAISAHLNTDELPWAVWDEGVEAKMLRVSRETGTWVIINRFAPGKRIPTHHHDGAVHAYTLRGRWHYLEYDLVASPGSFVFEQAGSTHTLEAMPDSEEPVEVFFVIEGGRRRQLLRVHRRADGARHVLRRPRRRRHPEADRHHRIAPVRPRSGNSCASASMT